MSIVLDGTAGITTPEIVSTGGPLVVNASAPDNSVVVNASGNVGIGTSSPLSGTRLTVSGAVASNGGLSADLVSAISLDFSGGEGRIIAQGSSGNSAPITFRNGASGSGTAERARIDSSGNLLVGTTSVDAAGSKVQLSSFQNRVFTIQNTANANGDQALWIKLGSNCNTAASPALICDTGGTNRLVIYGNGNVQNTNNSYGAISDAKLKENILDATPKLEKLNQVRVVNYNLKTDPDQKLLGVIAQELEQIFPGMVEESPDRDEEGNDLGTTTKGVKYSVFVPMLIKGLQELKAINDAQAQTIESLTARVVALEQA